MTMLVPSRFVNCLMIQGLLIIFQKRKTLSFITFLLIASLSLQNSWGSKIRQLTGEKNSQKNLTNLNSGLENEEDDEEDSLSTASFKRKHGVGLGLGHMTLHGALGRTATNGITWELYYTYIASYTFDIQVNVHRQRSTFQDLYTQVGALTIGFKAKLFQFDQLIPYVIAGPGFYSIKQRRIYQFSLQDTKGDATFGLHGGAGADLVLNRNVRLGLVGHYHYPFEKTQNVGPKVAGSYFKILLTSTYVF
jgi:opacity protein-like surface antigen